MCLCSLFPESFWHSQMFALQTWLPAIKKLCMALPSMFPLSLHVLRFPLHALGCSQLPGVWWQPVPPDTVEGAMAWMG